ncbi:DUF2203 domain-containing protein [bacterium]|nr:DUF2203 domain-containing protein [bacterium]
MNLYDKDDGFKTFTVAKANLLLPEIIATTKKTIDHLEKIKQNFEREKETGGLFDKGQLEEETARVLQMWSEEIVEFGVYPKGYFTVDFKTSIPDTLLCWTYGEEEILHTHKIYETFKERKPIQDKKLLGFEESLN